MDEVKDKYGRQKRYHERTGARTYSIQLMGTTEADMIAWLDAQPAKATYIKRLIREDMAKQKTE